MPIAPTRLNLPKRIQIFIAMAPERSRQRLRFEWLEFEGLLFEGLLPIKLRGVASSDDERHGAHENSRDDAAEIEEQHPMTKDGGIRAAQRGKAACGEQDANLCGTE